MSMGMGTDLLTEGNEGNEGKKQEDLIAFMNGFGVTDPALGGIASPSGSCRIVPEAERVCRSSDWNTSVSLARLCGARERAPSRSGAGLTPAPLGRRLWAAAGPLPSVAKRSEPFSQSRFSFLVLYSGTRDAKAPDQLFDLPVLLLCLARSRTVAVREQY
jgi:hypothetical protein